MGTHMPEMRLDPPEREDCPARFIEAAETELGDAWLSTRFPNQNGCLTHEQCAELDEWLEDRQDLVLSRAEELWTESELAKREERADAELDRRKDEP
jgi:hypothetical protein